MLFILLDLLFHLLILLFLHLSLPLPLILLPPRVAHKADKGFASFGPGASSGTAR